MEKNQSIIKTMKLNNYFIDDEKEISFQDFYSKIIPKVENPESNVNKTLEIGYKNYIVKIIKKNSFFCDINLLKDNKAIKKTFQRVFIHPIKLIYQLEVIEIAFLKQLDELPQTLNLKFPILNCINHDEMIEDNIKDLVQHFQRNNGINHCKIEISEKKISDDNLKRKFYNVFESIEDKNEFETPIDFDINYENYFDFYKYQIKDNKFEIFDDNNFSRYLSISNLCMSRKLLGYFRIYYGQEGMGKSITLIKTFKYNYNHDLFGTLYIHCKCLFNYYNRNLNKFKKILKDEIIYLFKNEYNKYKNCCNFIDESPKNNNFFEIIINIINKFCNNESKEYIFIFDQYKAEYDLNKDLNKLNDKIIKNNKKYGIIACCSMDNESIRELKIKNLSINLFEERDSDENSDNIVIKEINEIFDISNLTIDNGGIYDKTLNKIGKTLKNYIILKEFFRNNNYKEKERYEKFLKEKIKENLIDFFKLNRKVYVENWDENLINLYNILSFTINTEYKLEYLKKIKNLIPFKYFDIKLLKKDDEIAKVVFNYELIGEVMNKIYEYIIYENKNIYQIFDNINLDEGALGGLYEKYVIHFMEPNKYTNERLLFNLFNIQKIITVDKFVPKSNEKYFENEFNTIKLIEGDYLFKQEQFAGKAFDCAIIRIKKNSAAEVFLFQISIYKSTLYSIIDLNSFIEEFIRYFNYQFMFKINKEDVYFTYIFHTREKNNLYSKCAKKKLKCIFFNPSIQRFTNINNADLDDIDNKISLDDIFINPFNIINNFDNDIIMKDETNEIVLKDILKPNFALNDNQKKGIVNLWKNLYPQFKNIKIDLSYSHTSYSLDQNFLSNKTMYLRQLYENEIDDWIKVIIDVNKDAEITKKNNLLLVYKKTNLYFRVISNDGIAYQIEYIPIRAKVGIKN